MSDTSGPGAGQSLGVGSIISEAFSLSFANFFKLLAIIIVPIILMGVVAYLLLGSMIDMTALMTDPNALAGAMQDSTFIIMYILFLVISVFISSFMMAAATKVIFDAKTGGGSLGAAFSVGFSRAVQLFVSFLVLYIVMVIVFAVIGGILGFIIGMTGAQILSIVLMIAIIIAGLWVMGAILPFAPIVVLENRWISAIGRTFGLTKGYRWWNVLLMVLFFLAYIVVALIMALLVYIVMLLGMVGVILAVVIYLVGMVVIFGAYTGIATLDYARLREIKEGTTLGAIGDVFD